MMLPVDSCVTVGAMDFRPGYWVARTRSGVVLACCETPEELDACVIELGESPDCVLLSQVPVDYDDVLGGVEIDVR
jgi:hypothetical protein